ncbi:MAG: glycosyltransferase [Pseudomonadota bacterium]|nr:glycosyltransferase [Pseudomonadota bacterium]
MIRLFAGYDAREAIGFAVFVDSVIRHASQPVSITPLASQGLPQGSNEFTLSRFLVPYLCNFEGHAIFADGCDMLMVDDVAELDAFFDPRCPVQVVQHKDYETIHARKYVGTTMECENRNYHRKNWASLMIINCEHDHWRGLEPQSLQYASAISLLDMRHVPNIGALPAEWNVLADERQDAFGAKLLHWTAGIPAFDHYRDAPCAKQWHAARAAMERI